MDYRAIVAETISRVLAAAPFLVQRGADSVFCALEVPPNRRLGDFAFPCYDLATDFRKGAPAIAAELSQCIRAQLPEQIDRVAATGPYVNFHIATPILAAKLVPAILDGALLARRPNRNKRVMIEYSQPNTHKAFHVGHTRNVALGDSLVRICEWAGYDVVAANYIGDEGAHIAKCLWYYRTYFTGRVPDERRGEFLGEMYTNATELLDFTTLTTTPHKDVITAEVLIVSPHSEKPDIRIVTVNTGDQTETVVCGGNGYSVGDIVAYAKPGARINGRMVEKAEKCGFASNGMICSESEIGLGDHNDRIYVYPRGAPLGAEIAELGRHDALPDDVSVVDEMNRRENGVSQILKALEDGESEIANLWRETRRWSLHDFNEIYEWLNVRFDHFFYESEVNEAGKRIVKEYCDRGILVRSEGTIGADLTEYNLPYFILLRSDGTGLYSTKDIGLAHAKFEEFGIDRSIYVVDASQSLHFQQVFKTLELMGFGQAKDCFHLAYGMVVLPEGKMSSRKGNVILFSELRERLLQRIHDEYLGRYAGEWPEAEIAETTKRIAIATIKYGMLNQDNNKNIVFDLEQWISRSGNTGPYLLYAYARIVSILGELGELQPEKADWSLLSHSTEADLLRHLMQFPATVMEAAEKCQPQRVCTFLYDLSKALNRFYETCPVRQAESFELGLARGLLIRAVGMVLQKGLELIGIRTIDRM